MEKVKKIKKIENKKVNRSNSSTGRDEESKVRKHWTHRYINLNMGKLMPIAPQTIEVMFKDFYLDALTNEDTIYNSTWFRKNGVPISSVYDWKDLTEHTKVYWREANEAIGDRRERGAYNKEKDVSIVLKSNAYYKQQWKEIDKYNADLKKESGENRTQVVVIDSFGSSEDK